MRNPEEYLDEVHFHKAIRNTLSQILSPDGIDDNMYERLLKAFSLIQKEVYNQAIEDAANNAKVPIHAPMTIDKNSILKLKIK